MAYRFEKSDTGTDLVIDGFQTGIADSPYSISSQTAYGNITQTGIADMRNVNVLSVPGDAGVAFSTAALTLPPVLNAASFTATTSTNIITISSTTGFYSGMAVIINSISGGTGITSGNTYYVSNITSTTFKIYTDMTVSSLVTISGNGSGTLTTPQLTNPVDSVSAQSNTFDATTGKVYNYSFILADNGYLWYIGNGPAGTLNTLYFCGNTSHSTPSSAFGVAVWKGYLFVFLGVGIDYISIGSFTTPNGNWTYGWKGISASNAGHKAVAATDDALYFCNAHTVGSILENAGKIFDPATSTTYTFNTAALTLPAYDYARCLAQLGTSLLVGGVLNYVYPWDRVNTSFTYPLILAENYVQRIVSTNSTAYIFAGERGRIYQTNGANLSIFKKFPDQLSGVQNPYYRWGDAVYKRNQLYFSLVATDNSGTAISNFSGMWAIDLDSGALYLANSLSYGTYAGSAPVLVPMGNPNPAGYSMYIGWIDGNGATGIDAGSSNPYSNFEAYIDTDIVPVGTYFDKGTNRQIEYKLSKPLVASEGVQIWWRGNLTSSFTQIPLTEGGLVGDVSAAGPVNFEKTQWVQFRIKTSSTNSNPSFTRLREIRLHSA